MDATTVSQLSELEGRHVSVALKDGTRIDDCQLVALPIRRAKTFWLFTNGQDLVIRADEVVSVWECVPVGV